MPCLSCWLFGLLSDRLASASLLSNNICLKESETAASSRPYPLIRLSRRLMFSCPRHRISNTSLVRRHHFSTSMAEWPYPIYASARLHDRNSIFLAHASRLPSNTMLPLFLEVLTTSPTLKKARVPYLRSRT
ncbi:hypothetical protein F5878DRAFT_53933 [Lentinula raphanica]|uniref:Secreted protein n=1 Tax=Lentinula raphanica TaxID=153919 RepID=A0AA38U3M9_9AGAR|nr:hypothetical protein F5878DRAFT_53933 [Lentinula raphanica]